MKNAGWCPSTSPATRGAGATPELTELLGEKACCMDVNSMKPLDNLCHPVSVIREAEELAARLLERPMPF